MTDGPRTMNVGEARRRATRVDGDGHLTLWGAAAVLADVVLSLLLEAETDEWNVTAMEPDKLRVTVLARIRGAVDDIEDATLRTHDAFGCNLDTEASGRYACNACVENDRRATMLDALADAHNELADAKTVLDYSAYHDLDDDDEVQVNEALREASLRRRDVLRERKQSGHDADGRGRERERGAVLWTDLKHELGLCESSDDVAREEIIARIRSGVPDAPDLRHPIDKIAHRLAFLENVIMTTRAELRREGLLFGGDA